MTIKVDSDMPIPSKGEASIYVLKCPVEDKVRYVGKSLNLESRYRQHLNGYNSKMTSWMFGLEKQGLRPLMIEIEKVEWNDKQEREKYWIEYYESNFGGLLNTRHNPSCKPAEFPITYLK